jgi:hypothetical protein
MLSICWHSTISDYGHLISDYRNEGAKCVPMPWVLNTRNNDRAGLVCLAVHHGYLETADNKAE